MNAIVDELNLDDAVAALRFLSDRNRLRILSSLSRSEICVCDLIDELQLPQTLVSYHLGKLRNAGIVQSRRDAQWIYYSLDPVAWPKLLEPLNALLGVTSLPPEAEYGANKRCLDVPADAADHSWPRPELD